MDYFISYNKADLHWAEWIAWQLEDAGYTTFIQAWDFRPGHNFAGKMHEGASEATRTIAVLSPDYLTSVYAQPEWLAAFASDPTGEKRNLIPIRVRPCELTGLQAPIIYVDLHEKQEDDAKSALLAGVSDARPKPISVTFPGAKSKVTADRPRFPGELPPIWNIHQQRNRNFSGRTEELSVLREALCSGRPTALTQAVSGLGGIGKTQLALEYCYRFAGSYDIVWWILAEDPARLAADYAALATELELPEGDSKAQERAVNAVHKELDHRKRWLLVFDNAPDAEAVAAYLPQGIGGHVIVTSRDQNWEAVADVLSVKVMPEPDAIEFLQNRSGKSDREGATELAHELGCLPLAMEQAAAYIRATSCSFADYLVLLSKSPQAMMAKGKGASGYAHAVTTTWEISFKKLEEESSIGAQLLNLCAFLAPDDIMRDLINKGAEHYPDPLRSAATDTLAINDAIAALRKYSLITVTPDALSMHRLVRIVVSERLDAPSREAWEDAALKAVNRAFPFDSDEVEFWPLCDRLLPHAEVVLTRQRALLAHYMKAGRLLVQVGLYLKGRGRYVEAKGFYLRALALYERSLGPDDPAIAGLLGNLGIVLRVLGELKESKEVHQRDLAMKEKAYGLNDERVAVSLSNLGNVLSELNELEAAKACAERAISIAERTLSSDDPHLGTYLGNFSMILFELGDLQGSLVAIDRALAIYEMSLGPEHPSVATAAGNRGVVLRKLGDMMGARVAMERALSIFRHSLGEEHPDTVKVRKNLESLDEG